MLTHTRDYGGFLVIIDQVCYEIRNDPERTKGTNSNSDRSRHRIISERRYNIHEEDKASGEGVKCFCKGFYKGKHY